MVDWKDYNKTAGEWASVNNTEAQGAEQEFHKQRMNAISGKTDYNSFSSLGSGSGLIGLLPWFLQIVVVLILTSLAAAWVISWFGTPYPPDKLVLVQDAAKACAQAVYVPSNVTTDRQKKEATASCIVAKLEGGPLKGSKYNVPYDGSGFTIRTERLLRRSWMY